MKYFIFLVILLINYSVKSQKEIADSNFVANPINLDKNVIENVLGIDKSLKKLKSIKDGRDSTFVIVHFGDSHIQMGHFSGTIKKNLQITFGDCGDGILFPYSACKSFGPRNLKSNFSGNWDWDNIITNKNKIAIGVTGYGLKTNDTNASINFKYVPENLKNDKDYIKKVKIFHGKENYKLVLSNQNFDLVLKSENVFYNWDITTINTQFDSLNITLKLKKTNDLQQEFSLNGILFESSQKQGVQYHQCGVVGAQFLNLIKNSSILFSQLKSLKPDLIIFSYGSNESYSETFDSKEYFKEISNFIKNLRQEIPQVEFLITTTPDTRSKNEFPKYTKAINNILTQIAKNSNSALWDLNSIMGGDSSMQIWYENELANKDKLHFVKSGYNLQGNLFSLAFFNAFNSKYPNSIKTNLLISEIDNLMLSFKKGERKIKTVKIKQIEHKVKKGDTITNLAKKYNCSKESIIKLNKLTSTNIKIDQILIINLKNP